MSLRPTDILCRFIRVKDWSTKFNLPKPTAFKQEELSVWHKGLLDSHSVPLDDLRIGSLVGAGQSHLEVQDYKDCEKAVDEEGKGLFPGSSFVIHITPQPDKVEPPWQQWGYAHYELDIQVTDAGPSENWQKVSRQKYRNLLIAKAKTRVLIPPDQFIGS